MVDWTQIIGSLLIAVLTIILPILARLLGKYVSKKIESVDNELVSKLAGMAVLWVEAKFKEASSEEKFAKVYDYIEAKLAKMKVKVDEDDIEKVIEATVQALLNSTRDLKNE